MTTQRPFRFGVAYRSAASRTEWVEQARKIESLGYNIMLATDHLEIVDLAPSIALMTAADVTSKLRIGSFVFNNDFRHPLMRAKEAATLDFLSDGRFELGIGPGYLPDNYERSGIPLDRPGVRIARMEESLRIIRGFFSEEKVTFSGKYYTVHNLQGLPLPIQKPYPPIYIGGGGQRILSVAAREADIIGLTAILKPGGKDFDMADITAEATAQKLAWVRQAAEGRFSQLEINSFVFVVQVTDQRERVAGHMASHFGLTPAQLLASPHCLIGTTEQICADLQYRRDRYGISYITVLKEHVDAFAPVVAHLADV
jgi:probable F420-dependent oxidoreductase